VATSLLAQFCRLGGECGGLIMQRDNARRAQDRLAQPAQAEQQEQDADDELQRMQRDTIEQRSEREDDKRQHDQPGEDAESGWPPAAHDGDGQHDRQRLDRLDQRGQERGRNRRPNERQTAGHASSPIRTGEERTRSRCLENVRP
jgi:hypothetical protein